MQLWQAWERSIRSSENISYWAAIVLPKYTSNKGSSISFISHSLVKTIPPPRWQTAPRLTVEVSRPTNVRWACGFPDGQVEAGRLFSTLFPPTTDQPVLIGATPPSGAYYYSSVCKCHELECVVSITTLGFFAQSFLWRSSQACRKCFSSLSSIYTSSFSAQSIARVLSHWVWSNPSSSLLALLCL